MSTSAGQVHALSDSEGPEPVLKKAKIEPIVISEGQKLPGTAAKPNRRLQAKKRKALEKLPEPCSSEDVLWKDIISVLGQDSVDASIEEGTDTKHPFALQEEVEVEVKILGSNGASRIRTPSHLGV